MVTFKGYLHRWLAQVTTLAPFTADRLRPILHKSAEAGVKQCTGPADRVCGLRWESGKYFDPRKDKDATSGAGETMNVFAAVMALLVDQDKKAPVTNSTGGTSAGDPKAGLDSKKLGPEPPRPITTGDRAGAAILTIVILVSALGTFAWSCMPDPVKTKTEG